MLRNEQIIIGFLPATTPQHRNGVRGAISDRTVSMRLKWCAALSSQPDHSARGERRRRSSF